MRLADSAARDMASAQTAAPSDRVDAAAKLHGTGCDAESLKEGLDVTGKLRLDLRPCNLAESVA